MTGFNHTLAGTIIAMTVHDPILIAPLALFSHFLLDALPHFGKHPAMVPYNLFFKRYLVVDAFLCATVLSTATILSPVNWLIITWGVVWATAPDFLWLLQKYSSHSTQWFFIFHQSIQWSERSYGWIYESVYFIVGLSLLISLSL